MTEKLRQELAAKWMLESLETSVEQLLEEKSALERALAEARQNDIPLPNSIPFRDSIPFQDSSPTEAPPPPANAAYELHHARRGDRTPPAIFCYCFQDRAWSASGGDRRYCLLHCCGQKCLAASRQ